MNEADIKREARFTALEYMVANLAAKLYLLAGASQEDIAKAHAATRQSLSQETMPGLDPALGDLAVAEVQAAIEHLLAATEESAAMLRRPRG